MPFKQSFIPLRSLRLGENLLFVGWTLISNSPGTGSGVMQRIAAPMVGGMMTVTVLSLLVLPVIYGLVLQWHEHRQS